MANTQPTILPENRGLVLKGKKITVTLFSTPFADSLVPMDEITFSPDSPVEVYNPLNENPTGLFYDLCMFNRVRYLIPKPGFERDYDCITITGVGRMGTTQNWSIGRKLGQFDEKVGYWLGCPTLAWWHFSEDMATRPVILGRPFSLASVRKSMERTNAPYAVENTESRADKFGALVFGLIVSQSRDYLEVISDMRNLFLGFEGFAFREIPDCPDQLMELRIRANGSEFSPRGREQYVRAFSLMYFVRTSIANCVVGLDPFRGLSSAEAFRLSGWLTAQARDIDRAGPSCFYFLSSRGAYIGGRDE